MIIWINIHGDVLQGSIGDRFKDFQNWQIFKKNFDFDTSAKSLHNLRNKRYHFGCVSALKHLWTGNQKRSKMTFFVNFDIFLGISLVLPRNITDVFAATDISMKYPLIFLWKSYFPMTIKGRTLDKKSDIMIKSLGDSKIVSL